MRIAVVVIILAGFIAGIAPVALAADAAWHRGEDPYLEYRIEYHEPQGVTTVDAAGIHYNPFFFWPSFEATILPERYFGDYPLFFAGDPLEFSVHLKNTGPRHFRNLYVAAGQELLNPEGRAGTPFPDTPIAAWRVRSLGPGETVALSARIERLPTGVPSGIDQTHLWIRHDDASGRETGAGPGRVIVDDPQAGLWCPAPHVE